MVEGGGEERWGVGEVERRQPARHACCPGGALTRIREGGLPVALDSATASSHLASNSSNAGSACCASGRGSCSTDSLPLRAAGTTLRGPELGQGWVSDKPRQRGGAGPALTAHGAQSAVSETLEVRSERSRTLVLSLGGVPS